MSSTRQHHAKTLWSCNLEDVSMTYDIKAWREIPSIAPAAGFWKPDIDRMGSDLAHRPSDNAPTNCDSSESDKSNDSPKMRGV